MKFRLEFEVKKLPQRISHLHPILLMGSCFSENIGEKLKRHKFNVLENPNGILFNPVSVAEALTSYIENKTLTETDLFQWNDGYHSWKHHSRFSGITANDALQKINAANGNAHAFLKRTDYLVITLGSAWIYSLTEKAPLYQPHFVAANNHKAPHDWFQKKLLAYEEVLQVLDNVIHRLFHFNPDLNIVFTISPVRHLREGLVENNRSKAVLIQAVHHLVNKFDRLHYFPAYELVIDDLRDYRFYSEDLVHPNYFATQYVWEKLLDACMEEPTKKLVEEIHAINLAFQHKAFNPASEQHRNFLKVSREKAARIQELHPYIDFSKELAYFDRESK